MFPVPGAKIDVLIVKVRQCIHELQAFTIGSRTSVRMFWPRNEDLPVIAGFAIND